MHARLWTAVMKGRSGKNGEDGPALHANGEHAVVTSEENTVGILRDRQAQSEASILAEGSG